MKRLTALAAALTVLVAGLLAGLPATSSSAAVRTDEPAPSPSDVVRGDGASVGLRTATADGGDLRGHYEFEIPQRGRVVDYVAVSNLRHEPITVRIFGKDATTTTDSAFAVQNSEEESTEVGLWLSLAKKRITLPPRSETIVPFQVGVPHNAEPGDHAGALVVSLLAKKPDAAGNDIIVDHRVALRVLLRVPGDYEPGLTVTGLKAEWATPGSALGRGGTVVSYTVTNTGNLRVSATGGIRLSRVLGLPAVEATTTPIEEIQPGGEITVRQRIPGVFGTGPMKASVTLDPTALDPELAALDVRTASAEESFWAVPWLLLALVAAALLLGWGGARFEHRRRRARRAAMRPTGGSHRSAVVPDSRPAEPALHRPASTGSRRTRPGRTRSARGHRLARTGIALVLAGLGLVVGAPAHADDADVWQAKASVQQGTDNVPLDLLTTGGCPLPGTNVVGFAFGTGFPKEGGVVVGNGDAGVEARGPFRMPLSASLAQVMAYQPNPQPFAGVYRLELRCVTADLAQVTGKYVLVIRFTDPHHWKVEPPITTAQGPVTNGDDDPDPSSDPTDSRLDGGAAGAAAAPNAMSAEEFEAAKKRAQELAGITDPAAVADSNGPSWLLIGAGVVVLLATGVLLLRRTGDRRPTP